MKRNVIGALLSALVFPGTGQFYLHRRGRGWLLLLLAAGAAIVYADFAVDQATALADQVLAGSVPLDPAAMAARLEAAPTPLPETVAGIVFAACWIGGIVEALLVRER
ncbi:hypothetical protein QPK32_01840 [Massilia sp. YIM B02763]|uniref:hypothetical protein n=1 Tax=Massilia sp. YIM B02763 TaxID=3050130 RepID=UPI0025B65C4F|nr:hypothetical protein [Massilia sp. YIM B02763]MDN4051827.1 hypothetical protein [Massilia sp. YIM B02763]